MNAERRATALLDALHREPVWTVALRAAPAGWEDGARDLPALPFATAVWGGSPRQVADQLAALIFSNDGGEGGVTGPEHYANAEIGPGHAAHASDKGRPDDVARYWMQAAQVHATLALAAATVDLDDGDDWQQVFR